MRCLTLSLSMLLFVAATANAQNARDTAVREDKATLADDSTWLYDDFEQALDVAAKTRRPLMIVFR